MTMDSQKKLQKYVRSVAGKFAIAVSLISLFVGLLAAVSVAYVRIDKEEKDRVQMIDRMYISSGKTLINSLWMLNIEVVETVLAGISNLPGVEEVTVIADNGDVIKKGETLSRRIIKHEYPLFYSFQDEEVSLGSLSITVGLDNIFKQIYHTTKYLFLVIVSIALGAGGLTIVLFNWLLGQHLTTIAEHSANLNFDNLALKLSLKRRKVKRSPDELEQIVKAINHMQERISLDFQKREKAKEMLRESEEKLQDLYDKAPDMYASVDAKTALITECNETLMKTLDYTKEEIIGRPIFTMYSPEAAEHAKTQVFPKFLKTGNIEGEELQLQKKDGSLIDVLLNVSAVCNERGEIQRSRSSWRDITERKEGEEVRRKAEEQIQNSLKEKEVLLQEIHHRVKNNLQMVESLINLQLSEISDQKIYSVLEDSKNRIRSMALVHETLYRTNIFSKISIEKYLVELIDLLLTSMKPSDLIIKVSYDIEDIFVDIDTAIACGLIINELVVNSLKHAFINETTGNIKIELKCDSTGHAVMIVKDDGIGMPPDYYNNDIGTLGLQIVKLMAEKQLEAVVQLESKKGTLFKISFPIATGGADEPVYQ